MTSPSTTVPTPTTAPTARAPQITILPAPDGKGQSPRPVGTFAPGVESLAVPLVRTEPLADFEEAMLDILEVPTARLVVNGAVHVVPEGQITRAKAAIVANDDDRKAVCNVPLPLQLCLQTFYPQERPRIREILECLGVGYFELENRAGRRFVCPEGAGDSAAKALRLAQQPAELRLPFAVPRLPRLLTAAPSGPQGFLARLFRAPYSAFVGSSGATLWASLADPDLAGTLKQYGRGV